MATTLKNLQDLRTILGQLDAERPAGTKPLTGQTTYAERGDNFGRRLHLEITSRQRRARILVTGQIGVGKSSELLHYFDEQLGTRDLGFKIFCDLEKEEQPEHCGTTGVLLAVFRDCWGTSRVLTNQKPDNKLCQIRDEVLNRLVDWLKGQYSSDRSQVVFRFGGMDFPMFLAPANRDAGLALILGKAAQHEAVSQPSDRFGLAPDGLINLLNKLLGWFSERTGDRAPVLFVDHVDKIRNSAAAEEVLVKATPHWNRVSASIVMTAPYESTLGELRNSIESKWGRPLMLYPVEVPDLEAGPIPAIYERIIKGAQLTHLIDESSLRLLAYYSGGILRLFVQFLIQACKEAHFAGRDAIGRGDAMAVIHAQARAYQDYSTQQLELLDEIDRQGTGLGQAAVLLRSPIGLLVREPRGEEQQIRIHPLAFGAMERYRLRRSNGRH